MMMKNSSTVFARVAAILILFSISAVPSQAKQRLEEPVRNIEEKIPGHKTPEGGTANNREDSAAAAVVGVEDRLKALENLVKHQQQEIQALREMLGRETIATDTPPATATVSDAPASTSRPVVASDQTREPDNNQGSENQKKLDELYRRFGPIRFSGDLRFRLETLDNQGFDSLVEPEARRRLRLRARLAIDGTINKHFDWGTRIATGLFTDPISTNQTLTDFFERKTFALDRAFIRYDSKSEKVGLQLVAGKFEPTFRRTQMVWDDDLNVEGASEAIYFKTKSALKQLKLVAVQLPFNEVTASKDGVLYGGQLQTDWQASDRVSANVNIGYYHWNRPDQVLFGLGASATQVNGGLSNGASLTGGQNGALGTTNRIIRDAAGTPIGLVAGFNLLDVLANVTWQASARYPVTFTFDFVHNLTDRVRDEKNGYWVGAQVGQTRETGDWLFGYYFTRIEQDAVLAPFNFSDILASNSRAHMPTIGYQLANNVSLQWTGLFSQRANKVVELSPFNRYLNRMQFDVIYKF